MDRVHRSSVNIRCGLHETFYLCARVLLCLYGINYFFYGVLGISVAYNAYLRFATVVFCILGYVIYKRLNLRVIRLSRFFIWYFVIMLISLVSSLYSPSDASYYTENIFAILVIGTTFSTAVNSRRNVQRFLFDMMVSGAIVFLILYANNLLYIDDRLGRTLTGGHLNQFAQFIMLTLFAAIAIFYLNDRKFIKIAAIIIALLDVYMLMLSGGRKYVITPIIMIFIIVLMQTQGRRNILKRIGLFAAVCVLLVVGWHYMMNNSILYASIGHRFAENVALDVRQGMIFNGLKLFFESPIWGHGENAFSSLIGKYMPGVNMYSHNTYIELLVNFGLIGFIWYFRLYFKNINYLIKASVKKHDKLGIFFSAFMLSSLFLITGIVSYSSSSLLFVFIVMALNVEQIMRKDE